MRWEEVFLFLQMWNEVARAWNNVALLRLMRYTQFEAETGWQLERTASSCCAPRSPEAHAGGPEG